MHMKARFRAASRRERPIGLNFLPLRSAQLRALVRLQNLLGAKNLLSGQTQAFVSL